MARKMTAGSKNTEPAKKIEYFLDSFTPEDYADGYESVFEQIEGVADEVDELVGELEGNLSEAESEIEDLKRQIEKLEAEGDR